MMKYFWAVLALLGVCAVPCAASDLELDLECLREAYPGLVRGVEHAPDGAIWLVVSDGKKLLYDDGRVKTPEEELAGADIEDSMKHVYPLEPNRPDLGPNDDPGRIRSSALLNALYGESRKEIEKKLIRTPFATTSLHTHARLRAPLAAFQAKIQPLLASRPDLRVYFTNVGCYCWRPIAGTNRLSPHSFGLAVDLNPDKSPYWRWSKLRPHPAQKTYPPEIVSLLEEQGFIWGGKWAHYDLMHFEYRPELILKARKLSQKN